MNQPQLRLIPDVSVKDAVHLESIHPYRPDVRLRAGVNEKRGCFAYFEPFDTGGTHSWRFFRYPTVAEELHLTKLDETKRMIAGERVQHGFLLELSG